MKTSSPKKIWERIEEQKKKLKMTNMKLSKEIDVPEPTIRGWAWRQAIPGGLELCKMAKALQTTTDYLIFGEKDTNKELADKLASLTPKQKLMIMAQIDTIIQLNNSGIK